MDRTVEAIEWNGQATTGNRWQGHAAQPESGPGKPQELEALVPMRALHPVQLSQVTFDDVLLDAKLASGRSGETLAEDLHISPGYLSRFLGGQCRQWAVRMVRFCRVTRSLAPLQVMADQLGCDLVPRARAQAYIPERNACLPGRDPRRFAA